LSDKFDCQEETDIGVGNLAGFVAYALQDCIDACSQYNEEHKSRDCHAVVLNTMMAEERKGNCWLKGGHSNADMKASSTYTAAQMISP